MTIQTVKIDQLATDGVLYLEEIRDIEKKYGLHGTYSYANEYLDIEQYVSLTAEGIYSGTLSILAIFIVVFVFTGSFSVTLLITMAVLLVEFFLIGGLHFASLAVNMVVVVNLVISVGLVVDFSAHIGHTYIVIELP